jgi:hypothetical protein
MLKLSERIKYTQSSFLDIHLIFLKIGGKIIRTLGIEVPLNIMDIKFGRNIF